MRENIVRCNPLSVSKGPEWKTDAYGFKRNRHTGRVLQVLRKRDGFVAVVHEDSQGLGLLPTAHSTCVLSDIRLLSGMNDAGRKARIPSRTCSPSWLHHFISIGDGHPRFRIIAKSRPQFSSLNVPSSPSFQLFPVIFLFSCFWRKYWATNHWLRYTPEGFSKSGLITVNSLLHERWEMDPEMGESSLSLSSADSSELWSMSKWWASWFSSSKEL